MNRLIFKSFLMAAGIVAFTIQADAQQSKPANSNFNNLIPVQNGSVLYKAATSNVSMADAASNLTAMLGLNEHHTFVKLSDKTDNLGFQQARFQQYYKGVLVEGGTILVHGKNGYVKSINGRVATLGNLVATASINKTDALSYAKNALNVIHTINDFPIELVIANSSTDADQAEYVLAYKVRIDAKNIEGRVIMKQVFVDAATGKIFKQLNLIKDIDVQAQAETLYSGKRTITTDSIALSKYRLHDNARKIVTYDAGGAEQAFSGSVAFINPRDYFNGTTSWDEAPALMEMGLFNVTNNMLTGLGSTKFVTSFTMKDYGAGLTLASWPDIKFSQSSTMNLPVLTSNAYVFTPDTTFIGGFGKVDMASGDFELTDSASFKVSQLTTGVHTWSDVNGNGGTYTVRLAKNPALDAHWGMEMTHDFYNTILNRNSYDGNGSEVVNYVNGIYPSSGTQLNAAALPAPYFSMVYGMGDGQNYDAFVALDVMGHEFTHMVTESNGNGGLDYQGESGALNESFSDIFGTSIEFFVKGSNANWDIGEDMVLGGSEPLRSMSDPKIHSDPDTYKGQYWITNQNNDNGGVHTNSGVQNKWFYLLTHGGSGTNDKGNAYTVAGIGIEKAEKITYRNLTTYITSSATYQNAADGSLAAALDLYNNDSTSQEYKSVKDAWYAVGIGSKPIEPTAIQEANITNEDLTLYPNPTTGRMTIASSVNQNLEAQILNVVGVPVMKVNISKGLNPIDVSGLSKGVYLIRYNTGSKGFVQKFTIL